jgi:CubicO group peptidase (beta-lactamase class C family)
MLGAMRPLPWLVPLLLSVTACGGAPVRVVASSPPAVAATPATKAVPSSVSPHEQRFAQPAELVPTFTDPQRRARILALLPRLEAHFAERAARTHMPGLAIGLVVDGDLVWSKGYGVRDLTTKAPVDADTIFRIASVTKSFTGMALLQLRDAGKVSLDDPAEKVLPELAGLVYPTRDSPRITLRHLLTHTSGLPHDSPLPLDETHGWPSDAEELASIQGMELESAPGVRHSYSNLGFVLAGMIVARVSGTSYADYLASHVLQPLGMASTGFSPSRDRLASGYVSKGDTMVQPPMIDTGTAPSGGLFSTVRDLARYAAFQLSAWPPRDDADEGPLRRSSAREAQRMSAWDALSVAPLQPGKHVSATAAGYGYGWVSYETCDWESVVWHNGALTDGYRSVVLLLPDRGIAIVALSNLFEETQQIETAVYDGALLLGESGALPKRVLEPSPTLLAARDAIMALRVQWDDALAKRIFFDNVPPGSREGAERSRGVSRRLDDGRELQATTVRDCLRARLAAVARHPRRRHARAL